MRLFVSHSWSANIQYQRLLSLLTETRFRGFENLSVPSDSPVAMAVGGEQGCRQEMELQEDRLMWLNDRIRNEEQVCDRRAAPLQREIDARIGPFLQAVEQVERRRSRASVLLSRIDKKITLLRQKANCVEWNRELLDRLLKQGRGHLIPDQQEYVHKLDLQTGAPVVNRWVARRKRVEHLAMGYESSRHRLLDDLGAIRRSREVLELEGKKNDVELAFASKTESLRRERQFVEERVASLGGWPVKAYNILHHPDVVGFSGKHSGSVTANSPNLALRQRVSMADVVLLVGTPFCTWRSWVGYEMSLARHYEVPLIAIVDSNLGRGDLRAITGVADFVVNWDRTALTNAIEKSIAGRRSAHPET